MRTEVPGWDIYKVVCKPGGNCACLETVANPHRQEINPMWTQIIIRCVDLCTKPDVNGLMPKKPLSGSLRAWRWWYTNILEFIISRPGQASFCQARLKIKPKKLLKCVAKYKQSGQADTRRRTRGSIQLCFRASSQASSFRSEPHLISHHLLVFWFLPLLNVPPAFTSLSAFPSKLQHALTDTHTQMNTHSLQQVCKAWWVGD